MCIRDRIDADNPTKRIILSQVNSIYDPLGLAGPFTVRAKIVLRQLWAMEEKLNWDDPIPGKYACIWGMCILQMEAQQRTIQMQTYTIKKPTRANKKIIN